MAVVYRGEQDAAPKDVAVKVMHPHLAQELTFVKRFEREAKAASKLNHPNTVHIIDYGVDDDVVFMVMELLVGTDLYDLLARERRLSEQESARIGIETCEALVAAHELGIVHRDLKPENIMLTQGAEARQGHVKVLDFGIAKLMDRERKEANDGAPPSSMPHSALTTVGMVIGTPAYMSPEQCRGEAVDGRSDIYSCGVLLYQLLTGQTPFVGDSPIEIALAQVRDDPKPPSEHVPGLHRGLEAAVLKALSKWPAQRHETAKELRDELALLLPELSNEKRRVVVGGASAEPGLGAAPTIPALPGETIALAPKMPPRVTERSNTEPTLTAAAPLAPPLASPKATPVPRIEVRDENPESDERQIHVRPLDLLPPRSPPPEALDVHADEGSPWLLLALAVGVGVVLGLIGFFVLR
jgi:serine/threonine protein kinase